jgi:hypothetical protein
MKRELYLVLLLLLLSLAGKAQTTTDIKPFNALQLLLSHFYFQLTRLPVAHHTEA